VVRNRLAADFLKAIQPYTIVKREQVDVALNYPLAAPNGKKYGNVGNPIPDEVQNRRVAIAHELRAIRAGMKTAAKPARVMINA
jgi:hypothetical protein